METAEFVETEDQSFDLEEISESERIAIEMDEAAAIRRNLISICERILNVPSRADDTDLTDAQRAAVEFFRSSEHLSARLTAIERIDEIAARALTMSIAEFKFCLNGALDLFQKTYTPEAECVRQLAIAFDDEIPELAAGLADVWKSYGAGEMREMMKRSVYVKAGL